MKASPTTDTLQVANGGGTGYNCGTLSKKSSRSKATALANALLISRASNMQSCESLRNEIVKTIGNCDKALIRLNEFISQLKSQKIFKDVQFYLNQQKELSKKENNMPLEDVIDQTQSAAEKKLNKSLSSSVKSRSESANGRTGGNRNSYNINECYNPEESRKSSMASELMVNSSTICQDFIQNRLYLNKAMMNTVEQYLESIKLQQSLADLCDKIDLDKEILLVFTHLKQEEKYLSSLEPLQPLFRRYSIGFERCIQIWRRKCSADSLLLFNEPFVSSPPVNQAQHKAEPPQFDQLYICNVEDSEQLDRIQCSYASSATHASKMPTKASHLSLQQEQAHLIATSAAAAAAAATFTLPANYLKRSSTELFNQYSNLVDNCLSQNSGSHAASMPRSQTYSKTHIINILNSFPFAWIFIIFQKNFFQDDDIDYVNIFC